MTPYDAFLTFVCLVCIGCSLYVLKLTFFPGSDSGANRGPSFIQQMRETERRIEALHRRTEELDRQVADVANFDDVNAAHRTLNSLQQQVSAAFAPLEDRTPVTPLPRPPVRILFDGVEVSWPAEIRIEVEPGHPAILAPLRIVISGGIARIDPIGRTAAVTITGENNGALHIGQNRIVADTSPPVLVRAAAPPPVVVEPRSDMDPRPLRDIQLHQEE